MNYHRKNRQTTDMYGWNYSWHSWVLWNGLYTGSGGETIGLDKLLHSNTLRFRREECLFADIWSSKRNKLKHAIFNRTFTVTKFLLKLTDQEHSGMPEILRNLDQCCSLARFSYSQQSRESWFAFAKWHQWTLRHQTSCYLSSLPESCV